jgi:hypothetical protein
VGWNLLLHNNNVNLYFTDQTKVGVSKWAGTRYFYPSEIVYNTGRNYWTLQN